MMERALWLSEVVQDWVQTCLLSLGMERHRWTEQGDLFLDLVVVHRATQAVAHEGDEDIEFHT